VAGASAQTLTLNGTGFEATSTVTYNDVGHAATYVSSTQLTISLSASDQATAGSDPVVVTNPAPGGGTSNTLNFTVLPLSAPTGLAATAGNTEVNLTWNASTGASSYNVYNSTTNGGPYTEITSVTTPGYTNTGLTNGTTYYYVVTAVNSSGPSGYSNQASATPSASISWSNGYTNMRTIMINSSQVPNTNQTNFPVLISLPANTYADLKTTANGGVVTNANGYDIIFTSDAAGTIPLAYERESYSGSTGAMIDWVNVPTVSHSANTAIYLFYGNSAVTTDQSNPSGTWDSNYAGVYHLPNGTTLSANDSTSNGNSGTINGATATTGQIDGGASFNGSSQYISVPGQGIATGQFTISGWVNATGLATWGTIIKNWGASLNGAYHFGLDNASGKVSIYVTESNGTQIGPVIDANTVSTGTWYYFVATADGSNVNLYRNGSSVGTPLAYNGTLLNYSYTNIGAKPGNNTNAPLAGASPGYWDGALDELRVSNVARSADWIQTEYNNQSSPSTFYSVGAAVTGGGEGASSPAITSLSPTSGALGASVTPTGSNFGSSQENSSVQFNGGFASLVR
jgi:hypothetical protein